MNESTKEALELSRGHKKDQLRTDLQIRQVSEKSLKALNNRIDMLTTQINEITETLGDGKGTEYDKPKPLDL